MGERKSFIIKAGDFAKGSLDQLYIGWDKLINEVGPKIPRGITAGMGIGVGGAGLIGTLKLGELAIRTPDPIISVPSAAGAIAAAAITSIIVPTMFLMVDARDATRKGPKE